jgi:hypothetical protein
VFLKEEDPFTAQSLVNKPSLKQLEEDHWQSLHFADLQATTRPAVFLRGLAFFLCGSGLVAAELEGATNMMVVVVVMVLLLMSIFGDVGIELRKQKNNFKKKLLYNCVGLRVEFVMKKVDPWGGNPRGMFCHFSPKGNEGLEFFFKIFS